MPDPSHKPAETLPAPRERPLIDETVTAHILQIFGQQAQQYVPTQAQVDRILSLQEKSLDYAHEERTRFSPRQTQQLTAFLVGALLFVGIFVACLFYAKEYLGEVITGIVAFAAGTASGYGVAKAKAPAASPEDS